MPQEEPGAGRLDGTQPRRPPWVSGGVASIGLASFFSDAGHEIATAVLPSFVTGVLRGSAGVLGVIEGLSDALLGIAKLVAGPPANDPTRRLRIARGGYLLTAVLTAAIGLASTVWQAGVLRAAAWVSRGARGPARDALLASLSPKDAYGRSFGVERAGDNLGAVVGPLLASLLVAVVGIRHAFYFALVPGLCAVLAISVAAARAPRVLAVAGQRARLELGNLRRAGLLRPLLPVATFELGNVATTLLILRATGLLHHGTRSLTAAASLAILIYAAHNAVAAAGALLGGGWIDRGGPRGPRRVLAAGAAAYVLAYGGFALGPHAWPLLLGLFCLAGSGIGLAETAESTLVAQLLPDRLRGSGFGLLGGVQSAGDLLSSAVVGVLYAAVSPTVGFAYAAGWMALSLAASAFGRVPVGAR
jgi:MFS family permease